jgi:hypothetical protein
MKKQLLAIALIISLSSCQKCYKCTTTATGYQSTGTVYFQTKTETNFCGTPSKKTKHEKESSSTVPGSFNSKIVTKMSCVAE